LLLFNATDRKAETCIVVVSEDIRVSRVQVAAQGEGSIRGGRPPEPVAALIVEVPIAEESVATGQGREAFNASPATSLPPNLSTNFCQSASLGTRHPAGAMVLKIHSVYLILELSKVIII